jgi:hypothetical protein
MNLHSLDASGNEQISDDGIYHMNLHSLDAYDNPNINNIYNNANYFCN